MSESSHIILASLVLPVTSHVISQTSLDHYEDEYENPIHLKQTFLRKGNLYTDVLERLNVTEEVVKSEGLKLYITVISRNLHYHNQFVI